MDLTLSALNTTISLILRDLRLGPRSYTRTAAYADLVSLAFYAPNLTQTDAAVVDHHFRILADRYKWIPPKSTLDLRTNALFVQFQKTTEAASEQKKMPM